MLRRHEILEPTEGLWRGGGKIPELLSRGIQFSDSLAHCNQVNSEVPWQYDRYRDIADHLIHIKVNPHNAIVSDLIKLSYVMLNAEYDRSEFDVLNARWSYMYRFICLTARTAKEERELSLNLVGAGPNSPKAAGIATQSAVYVIHGERGVGKTFFLNCVLTKSSNFLDRKKVIWVRVNLAYRSGYEDNLIAWMHAQAAKVVCRYYERRSAISNKKIIDAYGHLQNWIDSNMDFNVEEKVQLRRSLRTMYDVFAKSVSDQPISSANCDPELTQELYAYLRKNGWSFIFVLDGFDRLDTVPDQIDRFAKIRSAVESFISMRASFGAAVVIVTRSETFRYLSSVDPFQSITPNRKFRIQSVSFKNIVTQRLKAIEEVVLKTPQSRITHQYVDLVSVINEFRSELFRDDEFFSELDEPLSDNSRAKLQSLYLLFLDHVNKKTGKGYAILEHIMKAGHRFPAVAYQGVKEADKIDLLFTDELSREIRFLPIVTRPPFCLARDGAVLRPPEFRNAYLLLGIRLLQILDALQSPQDKDERMPTMSDVIRILNVIFEYDDSIIDAQIREFEAFEVLRVVRDSRLEVNSLQNRVVIMPKGRYILKKYIGDIAYLNMCSMRTFFGKDIFSKNLIVLKSIDGFRERDDDDLISWIRAKICNSVFFVLFSIMY